MNSTFQTAFTSWNPTTMKRYNWYIGITIWRIEVELRSYKKNRSRKSTVSWLGTWIPKEIVGSCLQWGTSILFFRCCFRCCFGGFLAFVSSAHHTKKLEVSTNHQNFSHTIFSWTYSVWLECTDTCFSFVFFSNFWYVHCDFFNY